MTANMQAIDRAVKLCNNKKLLPLLHQFWWRSYFVDQQKRSNNTMYTEINFKTKKALKDALKAGQHITVYSPGPFPCPQNGNVFLEGPHYPEPHRWYASAEVRDGIVVKVA